MRVSFIRHDEAELGERCLLILNSCSLIGETFTMQEQHKQTAKPDFIVSLILTAFSLLLLGLSVAMPKYVEWGLYATPALAPIIFSLLLLIGSLILLVRSLLAEGYKLSVSWEQSRRFLMSRPFHNFLVSFGLVLLYYLMIGKMHFALISTLYLFVNILYFRGTSWWKNLIISTVAAVSIWYCFNDLFLIPLP
ncbi:hypothetical protein CSA56_07900 [candidate division KSB3 bacterium]|uniref:DUF1468 domain-containing protein n=1 Tax=candidate division KSB3 bacterium TaxID=2044937 RepID=A0A2G6KFY3_9BACT|nr:MAG: hypothetical protein CSA56_07900 [candidate division KSB3 bacterium]